MTIKKISKAKIIEQQRLDDHYSGKKKWLKWGPYLSERQWGTVREDYSENGTAWDYFPHDHARSKVYRWGEDGIAGISDDFCNLCFSVALWNGKDPIIKERIFGLTGPEGNHGEDVKELYYYLDSTPTHSYMKHLYKYPHAAFPYEDLIRTNRNRSKTEPEYEILDTGVFDDQRYFDVFTEYAKSDDSDILIKITVHNRGEDDAEITVLPTLLLRNLWDYGLINEKPDIALNKSGKGFDSVKVTNEIIGNYHLYFETPEQILFTENESNNERLYGTANKTAFVKDSINDAVVNGQFDHFKQKKNGTKFSPLYQRAVAGKGKVEIRLRLSKKAFSTNPLTKSFTNIFSDRLKEANEFYENIARAKTKKDHKLIQRQAFAGMMWSKQYFNIDIPKWLNGDKGQPAPPEGRKKGRNSDWMSLNNEDIISMPDAWEYPWYAAWDLAFHCVPIAMIDAQFAKEQLVLFLREWYMKPNGQMPAYEWAFGDVNPPVHAWACLQVYRIEKERTGKGDTHFLKRVFQKLLINFTWWVNRKDSNDNNIFEGGFLGLDNIGVFDRSAAIPGGGHLEQADGTSWMAMYSLNMLDMALEISQEDNSFEDVATKFFEHFVYIAESLNRLTEDWTGAWDEEEGFFYDVLALPNEKYIPLKVRSLVGLSTLFATLVLDRKRLNKVPDFVRRLEWFRNYRIDNNLHLVVEEVDKEADILLSLIPKKRLEKILKTLLDPKEFFSEGGIRSLSKIHENPYSVIIDGEYFGLKYEPAESSTGLFGGNSNWRGPIWMPMNYLIIQSLKEYHKYYGKSFKIGCPTGNKKMVDLNAVAKDISNQLISIFSNTGSNGRKVHSDHPIYKEDPNFKDLVLFYEYFHGDTGRGVGATHQTGWTGVVAELIDDITK